MQPGHAYQHCTLRLGIGQDRPARALFVSHRRLCVKYGCANLYVFVLRARIARIAGETICLGHMLTSAFDFQHGASYLCSIVTIALKCTVLSWGHGTDRQTDGSAGVRAIWG